jgi:hypothetical protein
MGFSGLNTSSKEISSDGSFELLQNLRRIERRAVLGSRKGELGSDKPDSGIGGNEATEDEVYFQRGRP